jgi:hypothetical protein
MKVKDFVKKNVAYHSTLNPVAWDHERLKPEVRLRLLEIAKVFVDYLEIPGFRVHDVVLTGSLANYNYTKFSDFDIHVVTEYADLQCDDLAEAFYTAKKKIWNDNHDITIKGHEAELYVEDVNEPPVSTGTYSLLRDEWLKQPSYDPPEINSGAVNHKVRDLITQIDHSISSADDPMDIKRVIDKIRQMRRSGLATGGEFSIENLAFKILRNQGYLDRLSRTFHQQQDRELSL